MKAVLRFCIICIFMGIFNISFVNAENNTSLPNKTISEYGDYYFIKNDNTLWGLKSNDIAEKKLIDNIKSICRNYAVGDDGTVWEIDKDTVKQLNLIQDVKKISSGPSHTLFIKNDNSLWGIGCNDLNQLGISGTEEKYTVPVKIMDNVRNAEVGNEHSIVLKTDGSVLTFGSTSYGVLGIPEDKYSENQPHKVLENMKDVFAGETSCFAMDENDTLYRWGTNYGNGVGLKDTEIQKTPIKYVNDVKAVNSHWGFNLILKTDNTLWIYGDSETTKNGYTCYPIGMDFEDLPVKICDDVNSVSEWKDASSHKTLILKNNGELFEFDLAEGKQAHMPEYKIIKITDGIKLRQTAKQNKIKQFVDIESESDEVKKSVNSLTKAGIVEGTGETEFSPDKPITRAEIAALLLRMTAKNIDESNSDFVDVTTDKWYYNIAGASKKYGIVSGFDDNTFRGDDTITRLQLVSLTSRTLSAEKGISLDMSQMKYAYIPEWAQNDIALAEQEGLINIKNELKDIDEPMTRGEAAVILYRLYEKI